MEVVRMIDDRVVTSGEWDLTYQTNAVTLRAACKGEGLAVSGTNAQRARRLLDAGLTYEDVIAKYGWKARRGL